MIPGVQVCRCESLDHAVSIREVTSSFSLTRYILGRYKKLYRCAGRYRCVIYGNDRAFRRRIHANLKPFEVKEATLEQPSRRI